MVITSLRVLDVYSVIFMTINLDCLTLPVWPIAQPIDNYS